MHESISVGPLSASGAAFFLNLRLKGQGEVAIKNLDARLHGHDTNHRHVRTESFRQRSARLSALRDYKVGSQLKPPTLLARRAHDPTERWSSLPLRDCYVSQPEVEEPERGVDKTPMASVFTGMTVLETGSAFSTIQSRSAIGCNSMLPGFERGSTHPHWRACKQAGLASSNSRQT